MIPVNKPSEVFKQMFIQAHPKRLKRKVNVLTTVAAYWITLKPRRTYKIVVVPRTGLSTTALRLYAAEMNSMVRDWMDNQNQA